MLKSKLDLAIQNLTKQRYLEDTSDDTNVLTSAKNV
jgi:hypothetical protein